MEQRRIKEVFPGGNSSLGFFSYYDYIIRPDATRIMVIKGGPGVGKSTFMKAIAEEMNQRGFDVELHHCSSDNNSLDGVVFPQLHIAMIDGTSPHIVDPKNPGAVDEILHLGDYWDEKGMRTGKEKILELNQEVGRLFRRAYQYLKAAKVIHDDIETIYGEELDLGLTNQKAADLIEVIFEGQPVARNVGNLRKLFASAITPDGFKNFLPSLVESIPAVYIVTGAAGTGKSTLVNKIASAALERGFDCEGYYCAFDPLKMEHLIIKELGVAIIANVPPHHNELPNITGVINMDECAATQRIKKYAQTIEYNLKIKSELLETAIAYLNKAKKTHDQMEEYYIPHMNFAAISALREKVLRRILQYAEEMN